MKLTAVIFTLQTAEYINIYRLNRNEAQIKIGLTIPAVTSFSSFDNLNSSFLYFVLNNSHYLTA